MKSSFYYTIAVIAVIISLFELAILFYSTGSLGQLTGYATATGTTNITVGSTALINFSTSNINWGSGAVNAGAVRAVLDTSPGSVTNGTWGVQSSGFVIQNIGNVNVTLQLNTALNATTFLGGTGPGYFFNVSGSTGACNVSSTFPLSTYVSANTTVQTVCSKLFYFQSNNSVRVDIRLYVPSDAPPGTLSDTITATYAQV